MTLVPCSACNRHARTTESACPFCGGALTRARPRRRADKRLGRAGLVIASLVLGACGSGQPQVEDPPEGDPEQMPEDPNVVAMYGAPAPEPGEVDPGEGEPAPPEDQDDGGMAPKYGAPPPPP